MVLSSKHTLPPEVSRPGMEDIYENPAELAILLEKIHQDRGMDFREYNKSTLARRLNKRLHARKVHNYADYAEVLDRDLKEYEKLLDVFTVNQTHFFRNPYVFELLKRTLGVLLERKTREKKPLRLWSAGCSTGQEPYSLAMILAELLQENKDSSEVHILATDLDPKAISQARSGLYPVREMEAIPEDLRDKYLLQKKGLFRCDPSLQELVTFEQHSLTAELPCHDMDLVLCRNVIIYFLMPLQMRVLRNFYQSLNPHGLLLLGESEIPMREARSLFSCLDFKAKLYRKAQLQTTNT